MKNTPHIKQFIRDHKNVSGVYAIVCTATWRSYVGSSVNIGNRVSGHFGQLKNNCHTNQELQSDFTLYNSDSFKIEVLELVDNMNLLERERHWSSLGYNLYSSDRYTINLPELTIEQRQKFESCIDKTGECWIWTGSCRQTTGYGRISVNGTIYRSHRLSFWLYTGINPENKILCHTCDNKKCVNPDHLFLGSHSDNHKDRRDKCIGNINLTWDNVNDIRDIALKNKDLYADDLYLLIIKNLKINFLKHSLFDILLNKTWYDPSWIPLSCKSLSGEDCPWSRLNWDIVNFLRSRYLNEDRSVTRLAKLASDRFNIDIGFKLVHKIVNNQRWIDPEYDPKETSNKRIDWGVVKFIRSFDTRIDNAQYILTQVYDKYGISSTTTTIINILANRTWIDTGYTPKKYCQESRKHIKLTWTIIEKIRLWKNHGKSGLDIVNLVKSDYNISITPSSISNIINNKTWRI